MGDDGTRDQLEPAKALLALHQARIGVFEILPDERLRLDDSYFALLGYDRAAVEEDETAWARMLIHPDDCEPVARKREAILSGDHERLAVEYRLRRFDGAYSWVRGTLMKSGNSALGVVQDISEAKQQAELNVEQSLRLNAILENMPLGLTLYRLDPLSDALTLVAANSEAERLLGIPLATRVGERFEAIFPAIVETHYPALWRQVARHGQPVRELQTSYQDDEVSVVFDFVAFRPAPHEVAFVFNDVTEATRARTELSKKESKLENARLKLDAAMELAKIGAWEWDMDADGWSFSKQWREIHGVGERRLSSEELLVIAHPEDQARVQQAFEKVISGGAEYAIQHRVVRQDDGETRMIRARGMPLKTQDGRVQRVVGFAQDVTEDHHLMRELERANESLKQFAYVVSHDLKAPLRGIRMVIGWLRKDLEAQLTDSVRENMDFLESRADRLGHLIEGVLAYSRAQRAELALSRFSSRTSLQGVLADLAVGTDLTTTLVGAWPELRGDRIQFEQVLRNLVDNAVKFAKTPGGTIELKHECTGRGHQFSVSDNGPGIPFKYREQVFGLFATLHSRDELEASGVGLAICYMLVDRWGGQIGIDDSPLGGATIWFTIPATHAAVSNPAGR